MTGEPTVEEQALALADELRRRVAHSEHGELPHVDLAPAERDRFCDEMDRLRAEVANLRRLVRLLHPDPAPDPRTAEWLQREGLLDELRRCVHAADDYGRCSDCHGGAAWRPCLVDPDAAAKLASRHTPASRWEADRG